MAEQTPVERAEDAVFNAMVEHGPDGHLDGYELIARAALEAALDEDELARVIEDADDALLAAGRVPATYLHPEAYQEIARRVKAWLVREET